MINYNKITFNKVHFILLFNLLLVSYFFLVGFKPIPDSTHYLASFLNEDEKSDLINWSILFIKTPFYKLFGGIFQSPTKYIVGSYLINFIFFKFYIFYVMLKISKIYS